MQDDIEFYESLNGKQYAKDFLDDIEKSQKKLWIKLIACLKHISVKENRKEPFSKALGGGMFEARVKINTLQGRINYCFDNKKLILLNGYIKNDKGTKDRGIELGRKLLKERLEKK